MDENNTSDQYIENSGKTLAKVPGIARLYRSTSTGIYYIRKSKGGRIFTRSLRTSSLPTVKRIFEKSMASLEKEVEAAFQISFVANPRGRAATGKRIKYRDGLELSFGTRLSAGLKYGTVRNLNNQLKTLREETVPLWGDRTIDKISSMDVQDFLRAQSEGGKAPGTRNIYLSSLRRVFNDMIECDRRNGVKAYVSNPGAPVRRLPVVKKITIPETKVVHRVLDRVAERDPHRGLFCRALLYTGARVNELMRITWRDIHLDKRVLQCPNSKAKVGRYGWDGYREIPFNDKAYDIFSKLVRGAGKAKPDDLVFPDIIYMTVYCAIKKACELEGVPAVSVHQLRHVFATSCIESGVDIPTIARWLGHSDGGVLLLKTYGHLRNNHSQAMAAKVTFTHE